MESGEEEDFGGLEGLPVEVQQYVVTLLVGHKGALYSVSLTCRLWHLLTLADVVWRKYAVEEWGALPPRSSSGPGQEEKPANDWLMMSFRRWRNNSTSTDTAVGGSTWYEMVRDTHQQLVSIKTKDCTPDAYMRVCVEKRLTKLLQTAVDDGWLALATSPTALLTGGIILRAPPEVLRILLLSNYGDSLLHPYMYIFGDDGTNDSQLQSVPLLVALKTGNEEAVDLLLERGASSIYPSSLMPLHYAVYLGTPKRTLEKLLRSGNGRPDYSPQHTFGSSRRWLGFEKGSALMEACASGNLDAVDAILAWRSPDGNTVHLNQMVEEEWVLWVAVESLFKYVVPAEHLEPEAARKQEARNERLWGVVGSLLAMGAKPNIRNASGQVLLSWIIQKYVFLQGQDFKEKLVRLLLEHDAQADEQDAEVPNDTPLHVAARDEANLGIMKLMLQHRPNINVQNRQGRTPVHEALLKGKREMAALLESHGANMHLSDVYGVTPDSIKKREHREGAPAFDIFSLPPVPLVPLKKDGGHRDDRKENEEGVAVARTFNFGFVAPQLPLSTWTEVKASGAEASIDLSFGGPPQFSLRFPEATSTSTSTAAAGEEKGAPLSFDFGFVASSATADDVLESFKPPSFDTILASTAAKSSSKPKPKTRGKRSRKKEEDDSLKGLAVDWKAMGIESALKGALNHKPHERFSLE